MRRLFKLFDRIRGPIWLEPVWRLLASTSPLTGEETAAAVAVLGPDGLSYRSVRVAQGGILPLVFRFNGQRAFVLFRTVNLPRSGSHARSNLGLLLHELVHVLQFERVGSAYIPEALHAQRTTGYGYGGWEQLIRDRASEKRLTDYNREQQAQIAQDYHRYVLAEGLPEDNPVRLAYEPFIADLRRGEV